MRGIRFSGVLLILAISALSGCIFKAQPFKGVISYRQGKVYIRHDKYYTVGVLADDWRALKTRARTISFYNEGLKASISTDAYCGKSVTDRTLDSLSGDIITALEKRQVTNEKNFTLNERGALRQHITGSVDGVPTDVDLVIVRKNYCVFDFYSVAPAGGNPDVKEAFETFFNGFHYE
ncbi:MAG: hypothetical protein WC690_04270 [bacterium]